MSQFTALLISLVIEVPIVLFLLQKFSNLSFHWLIVLACGATMLTHPIAWKCNQMLIPYISFIFRSIFVESFVVLSEGILYWVVVNLNLKKGLLTSLIANIISFSVGIFILIFF